MKKMLFLVLLTLGSISIADENKFTIAEAQNVIDENYETLMCGKVVKVIERRGGGQTAICSNKEAYMLARKNGKELAMRCSQVDKLRAKGFNLSFTSAEYRG